MKQICIFGIIEPGKLSLSDSVAWSLVSTLKVKGTVTLGTEAAQPVSVDGVVPLLQPLRVYLGNTLHYLMFVRANLSIQDNWVGDLDGSSLLVDGQRLATVHNTSSKSLLRPRKISEAFIVPRSISLTPEDREALVALVVITKGMLWRALPINWTTHRHHLTSTGQFMHAELISELGQKVGAYRIDSGVSSIVEGIDQTTLAWTPRWAAGETVVALPPRLIPRVRSALTASGCNDSNSSTGTTGTSNSSAGTFDSSGSTFNSTGVTCSNCRTP